MAFAGPIGVNTSPGAGTPVADGVCAPAADTPATWSLDPQKLLHLSAVAKHVGLFSGERSADITTNVELTPDSVESSSELLRRSSSDPSSSTAQPSDDAADQGHDSGEQGQQSAPSEAELIEALRYMLCGDETTPRRSDSGWKVACATTGLAVLVVAAVEALYKELGVPKGKSLACTAGPVDREEAYGYLMADVMGSALLSAEGARYVGERARKKSAAHAAAMPEAKKQAKKRAKREAPAGSDLEEAASKAAADKERTLLDAELELKLPAPMPPPPKPAHPSQKRKRLPEPKHSEFDVPSCEEQLDAFKAALAAMKAAIAAHLGVMKLSSCAREDFVSAQTASTAVAERRCALLRVQDEQDVEDWDCKLLERLDVQLERAQDKRDAKDAKYVAVQDASDAARAVVVETRLAMERIKEWIRYPEVVTPFPWPGEEYILPCNLDDLDYYETCPRGFPDGVREWQERWYAHHRSIGLPLD